ncbi:MAG TPA: NAD(P)H-dependent glycerol-3-phosphate dehydrogenase [Thermodesulfobacteriota bacterium]|nr:NAD(P)-dependent glycerol-3-phosphate dehydrogenase [Deltaproteobacteria bacterium]HNR13609.1 NAD(P)H-dependent glycerol-3-phosphate dehydrogenase [Thermodesulfobacteriota bacterium]HNU71501.1 NAD(P)H-dependent glycerol-3-phosphate dehydrogenase [Thermodesulfobacteriota bacterium]HOC39464.1 NAD(P)H-dependent glycerol-3-phosphate dehydrogenase [Thermodesulfobacteriota bacterium]HQO77428.1 NAD(P)H-dependent glycerol-3-phosphate dehydrogenase [Thermodesulfobacteriota bacterium]
MGTSSLRIGIIGAGSWGTALATLLARNGHQVTLWVYEAEVYEQIHLDHENHLYLDGTAIPSGVVPTQSTKEAASGKQILISAAPSHVVRSVLSQCADHLSPETVVVSVSKGIENASLKTMAGVFSDILSPHLLQRAAYLSGPSFAREVAQQLPTAVVAASRDNEAACLVQNAFSSPCFRVYATNDVIGVELGGALKNVIAIAAGCADGLGFGHNTRAALITRGLAEISRLGVELGAHPLTFAGLSGLGDLVLTCTSSLSRNHTVGVKLGQGMALDAIVRSTATVAEGIKTTRSAYDLARRHGIEMPIIEQMYNILYANKQPQQAVSDLMNRSLRCELEESSSNGS